MRAVRIGALAGVVAGVVMAVWSMAIMWMTGSGFWIPLNLIAHMFYRSAPLNGAFSGPALIIGLALHMTVAVMFGIAITVLVRRLPAARSLVIAGGILFIAVVWPAMQYGVWYSLDEPAAEGFTDWVFAVAHLIFGLVAASIAAVAVADETSRRGRHAATAVSVPQPNAVPGSLFQPHRPR
ncbi:MAG TPA: hypothetical protein VKU39_06330 [Streptosporangiaceae bacterium]|nr:hypothetical protein [Streptosporangiaceae bacterium]